ncbi:MAG TPA: DUF5808 domain-containing protein [Polyangiaceae bacterium]|nr:DUF5808 domain-containing protein [Polyangiaceae bacterium]
MSRRVFPLWPAVAVVFCAAAYLSLRWDSIPDRWVVHWDARGVPNGWSARTVSGVYGLLGVAAGAIVVLEVVGAISRVRVAPGFGATRHFLRLLAFGLSVLVSLLAVVLPLGPALSPATMVGAAVAGVGLPIGLGAVRGLGELRAYQRTVHGGPLEGYHGLYYSNPKDSRLWVPKLAGGGWTINFAHRWAWPAILLVLTLPIALGIAAVLAVGPR